MRPLLCPGDDFRALSSTLVPEAEVTMWRRVPRNLNSSQHVRPSENHYSSSLCWSRLRLRHCLSNCEFKRGNYCLMHSVEVEARYSISVVAWLGMFPESIFALNCFALALSVQLMMQGIKLMKNKEYTCLSSSLNFFSTSFGSDTDTIHSF